MCVWGGGGGVRQNLVNESRSQPDPTPDICELSLNIKYHQIHNLSVLLCIDNGGKCLDYKCVRLRDINVFIEDKII